MIKKAILNVNTWQLPNTAIAKLKSNEVHIWRANLLTSPLLLEQAKQLLSADELQRGQRLYSSELRQRFWLAHAWKRCILAQYVSQPPSQLNFARGEYGKPFLILPADMQSVQFNMSHSGDMVLFAIMQNVEVGVDIELINWQVEALQLAQRFFAPEEYELLHNVPGSQLIPAFYRIWTLKEAVIKALGKGLHYNLSEFAVHLADDYAHCLHLLPLHRVDSWNVFTFPVQDQYVAAFAAPSTIKQCYFWETDACTLPSP